MTYLGTDATDHRSARGPKPPAPQLGGGITQYATKLPGITQKFGAEHQKMALKMVNLKQKRKFFLGLRKKTQKFGAEHQKMALKMVILEKKLDFFRLRRLSAPQEVVLS